MLCDTKCNSSKKNNERRVKQKSLVFADATDRRAFLFLFFFQFCAKTNNNKRFFATFLFFFVSFYFHTSKKKKKKKRHIWPPKLLNCTYYQVVSTRVHVTCSGSRCHRAIYARTFCNYFINFLPICQEKARPMTHPTMRVMTIWVECARLVTVALWTCFKSCLKIIIASI